MAKKRHRLVVERLELRQLLAANTCFVDSGQSLGTNAGGAVAEIVFDTLPVSSVLDGDANHDPDFSSKDLVQVYQAGKYGTSHAAAAEKAVPFKGSIQSVETNVGFQFPIAFQEGSGSGNATHLGRFTMTFEWAVNVIANPSVGSYHFIAANGDSIFTDAVGTSSVPDPIAHIVETHTITGGTGRFAGATGSFTLDRLLDTETGVSSGSFDGTIVIAKGP